MLVISLVSCESIVDPTFEGLDNVKLEEVSTQNLIVTADMVINNPNAFALDLAEAELSAIVEEIQIAKISQIINTQMPAKKDFRLPVRINMDLSQLYKEDPLGAISKGLKIMSDKQIQVLFQGEIKAGKGKALFSVPIDQLEMVNF